MEELAKEVLLPTDEVKLWLEHLKLLLQIENLELKGSKNPSPKAAKSRIGTEELYACGVCGGTYEEETDEVETGLDVTNVNFGFTGHVFLFVKIVESDVSWSEPNHQYRKSLYLCIYVAICRPRVRLVRAHTQYTRYSATSIIRTSFIRHLDYPDSLLPKRCTYAHA